jgi:two-component system, OmpR family, osmolarity sensor histidine kinase EnvZ
MVRRILGSIAVRTALVFLTGLLFMMMVILVVALWPDQERPLVRLVAPREAAAIASTLELVPRSYQPTVIAATSVWPRIISLEPDFPPDDFPGVKSPTPTRSYEDFATALQGRPFLVQSRRDIGPFVFGRAAIAVRLLVRLRTGQVLVIERAPVFLMRLSARSAIIAGAASLVMLAILLFCMHQMVWPARRLARAARGLALNADTPDLVVRGATEFRTAAVAFNDMKRTIRELMSERTRILAAIAHDLRTYLTRLRLRAEFIDDQGQRDLAVRDLDEMSLLLDDTLMFAREEDKAPAGEVSDIVDIRREIVAFHALRLEVGDAVSVQWDGDADLRAYCSSIALRRMLGNLVDNAVRYGKRARISAWREEDLVWMSVDDDGPGVPREMFGRIMEPFERLESSRGRGTGGAGLGLSIVKALARSKGGDLVLENRPGGGLRAAIRLSAAN